MKLLCSILILCAGIQQAVSQSVVPGKKTEGVIFGQGVRIRKEPSLASPELAKVSTGEKLEILEVAPTLMMLPGQTDTQCYSFPMIRVRTASGQSGWIFGKYVYAFVENYKGIPAALGTFTCGTGTYRLQACRNYGVGAWAEPDGLTGCDELYPVVLIEVSSGRVYPVSFDDPNKNYMKLAYWNLENDEGGYEEIERIQAGADQISIWIKDELMDGCRRFRLDLRLVNGKWSGRIKDVQEKFGAGCE